MIAHVSRHLSALPHPVLLVTNQVGTDGRLELHGWEGPPLDVCVVAVPPDAPDAAERALAECRLASQELAADGLLVVEGAEHGGGEWSGPAAPALRWLLGARWRLRCLSAGRALLARPLP